MSGCEVLHRAGRGHSVQAHWLRAFNASIDVKQGRCVCCSAEVDELVTRVRQLGTGVRTAAATASAAEPPEVAEQTVAAPAQPQPPLSLAVEEDQAANPPAKQPRPGGTVNSVPTEHCLAHSPAESGLCHSPTERLLGCHQRLQRRPLTAPGVGSKSPGPEVAQQRPVTGSPAQVKSLMQVGSLWEGGAAMAGRL